MREVVVVVVFWVVVVVCGWEVVVLGVDVDGDEDDVEEDGTRRITGVLRVVALLIGFSGRAAAWSVTAPEMERGKRVATRWFAQCSHSPVSFSAASRSWNGVVRTIDPIFGPGGPGAAARRTRWPPGGAAGRHPAAKRPKPPLQSPGASCS